MCSHWLCEAVPGLRLAFQPEKQNAMVRSRSRRDVLEQSRRKRSCSDYAKFEPDWRVDKRGGTLRHNKNKWITGARFGSNRLWVRRFNRNAAEVGDLGAEAQGVGVIPHFRQMKRRRDSARGWHEIEGSKTWARGCDRPATGNRPRQQVLQARPATIGAHSAGKLYAALSRGRWIASGFGLRFSYPFEVSLW